MKDSYFTTPRRMSDATFHAWADPIERNQSADGAHPAEWFFLAVVAFAVVLIVLGAA
jgi:hypothetical protein